MNNLFDLDFGRWNIVLLYLVPAAVNLCLFIYSSFYLPKSNTNYTLGVFVFLIMMWQLSDGFMMLSPNPQTAALWCKMLWMFLLFAVPFGVVFVLNFLRISYRIPISMIFVSQFVPPIFFLLFIITGMAKFHLLSSNIWYWIANPEPSRLNKVIYLWVSAESLLALSLLWFYYAKIKKQSMKRKQILLMALGFSVPVISGIIGEAILPLIYHLNDIPVLASVFTIFSVTAVIAIKHFDLLIFSPKHQWNQIAETMSEGIVIVDLQENIMYANIMFCNMMGYKMEEMKDKVLHKFLSNNYEMQRKIETAVKLRHSAPCELELISKSGEKIWVQVNSSDYLDSKEKVIGTISVHTSITERKKAESEIKLLNAELEQKVICRTAELANANKSLLEKADMLSLVSDMIEQKNKDMADSLNYAMLIQKKVIRKKKTLDKLLPQSFVINLPLNVVSGDFVSVSEKNNKISIALADCTGHGVPGAMVSMIGYTMVNEIVNNRNETNPPKVLKMLNNAFNGLAKEENGINDGMDVGFCSIDKQRMVLNFAGAHRPLYFIRNRELVVIKGDNLSIGGHSEKPSVFKNHTLKLQKNDSIYMFSDGYTDQFGGEKGKKFSSKRFKELLLSIQHLNMNEQRAYLKSTIQEWRGNLYQVDDICVVGVTI